MCKDISMRKDMVSYIELLHKHTKTEKGHP